MKKIIALSFITLFTLSCRLDQLNLDGSNSSSSGDSSSAASCPFKVNDKDLANFVDENWGQKFINYNNAASSVRGHVQTSKCEIIFALDTGAGTYALTKYKKDMTVDTSFGSNGFVNGDIGVAGAVMRARIAIDNNDNVFLGFRGVPGATGNDYMVYKVKASGQVAMDFGVNGRADIDLAGGSEYIGGIAPLPSGKILVHGQDPASYSTVVRLLANGSIDTSYGTAGKLSLRPTGSTGASSYNQLMTSDAVYIIGISWGTVAGYRCMVAKLDISGSLVTGWGINGFVEADVNSAIGTFEACYSARIDDSGNLYAFGESGTGAMVAKMDTATGTLDTSFDTDGVVYNFIAGADNYSHGGYILDNGKILLISSATAWQGNMGITLLNADGSLDTTFSPALNDVSFTEQTPGQLILNVGANDLTQDSGVFMVDGQIYLYFTTNANAFNEQVIYRLNI